jgi:hypothetical protein
VKPVKITTAKGATMDIVQDERDRIVTGWLTTETRTFTPEQATLLVENLEKYQTYSGVWLLGEDIEGREYAARVESGQLYAETRATEAQDLDFAPWNKVKMAYMRAVTSAAEPVV